MAAKRPPGPRAIAFKRWMKANNTNTKRVAERAGVSYTTLASFVQGGTQSLKGETEERITAAYGAPASEVFGGQESSVRRLPLISWVAAGQLADMHAQVPADGETIEIGGLGPGDYFATRVRGDSMNRVAPEGSVLVVNRGERDLVRGRRYIFTSRGKTTFKRFGGDQPFRLEPESLNPEQEPIYPASDETWEVVGRVRVVISEV